MRVLVRRLMMALWRVGMRILRTWRGQGGELMEGRKGRRREKEMKGEKGDRNTFF